MKTLVIDINKCNGCYNCQIACKDKHGLGPGILWRRVNSHGALAAVIFGFAFGIGVKLYLEAAFAHPAWLEPYAMDLWREELPTFMPADINFFSGELQFFFLHYK